MNITAKTVLTSALLTAMIAGTSAYADKAGNLNDYVDNSVAVESVEIVKVSFQKQSTVDALNVNR